MESKACRVCVRSSGVDVECKERNGHSCRPLRQREGDGMLKEYAQRLDGEEMRLSVPEKFYWGVGAHKADHLLEVGR